MTKSDFFHILKDESNQQKPKFFLNHHNGKEMH